MQPEREEGNVQVTLPDGRVVTVPYRLWRALRLAAENPRLTNRVLATKISVSTGTYNNYMGDLYELFGLTDDMDKRAEAIHIYNEHIRATQAPETIVPSTESEEAEPVILVEEDPPEVLARAQQEPAQVAEMPVHDHHIAYKTALIMLYILLVLVVFAGIQFEGTREGLLNRYANLYSALPFIGGLFVLWRHREMKGNNTPLGSPVWVALGLIFWSLGGFVWFYYNVFVGEMVPYPSWADLGYGLGNLFVAIGAHRLFRIAPMTSPGSFALVLVAVLVVTLGHSALAWGVRGWQPTEDDPIKLLLDVLFVTSGFYALLMAALFLSSPAHRSASQEVLRITFVFIVGIVLYIVADALFGITTSLPDEHRWAFYTGNITDLIYLSGFFVLSMALLSLPYTAPVE